MSRALYSHEAERSVIGAVLVQPSVLDDVSGIINESDFHHYAHRIIWSVIVELSTSNRAIDILQVSSVIGDRNLSDDPNGGIAYLTEMARNVPSVRNAVAYANAVAERSKLRDYLSTIDRLKSEALESDDATGELIDDAQSRLLSLTVGAQSREGVMIKDCSKGFVDRMERRWEGKESPIGLSTGIEDLDSQIMGLKPGQLIVIAGRPAMGKTTFMFNPVRAAIRAGLPCITFSMEMGRDELFDRLVAGEANVVLGAIKDPKRYDNYLQNGGWDRIGAAMTRINQAQYIIDDRPGISPTQIRGACKRWAQRFGGLSLITVDYLQLMHSDLKTDNREQQVASMSRAMKELAKEFNCPVVLLSQLNRGLEGRRDKRPMMADLRESGAIEQDADVILFPFREEVYNHEDDSIKGIAEIIVGKQRDGQAGIIKCCADLPHMQFRDLSAEQIQRMQQAEQQPPRPFARKSAMAEF